MCPVLMVSVWARRNASKFVGTFVPFDVLVHIPWLQDVRDDAVQRI